MSVLVYVYLNISEHSEGDQCLRAPLCFVVPTVVGMYVSVWGQVCMVRAEVSVWEQVCVVREEVSLLGAGMHACLCDTG